MKNTTGCSLLDEAGVILASAYDRADLCLKYPYEECVPKTRDDKHFENENRLTKGREPSMI